MADDEPLDDARQVATAAATAAARLVETAAREARDVAAQHRATLERSQDQQRARDALSDLGPRFTTPEQDQGRPHDQQRRTDLAQAQAGATPARSKEYHYDRSNSPEGRRSVESGFTRDWKAAAAPYDSQDRRGAADEQRAAAGVPPDARAARVTADLMNGTDPSQAAAAGRSPTSAASPPLQRSTRQISRDR